MKCLPGLVYKDCYHHHCERSCDNIMEEDPCPADPNVCYPGCYCPDGFVRKGNACVEPVECRDCKLLRLH